MNKRKSAPRGTKQPQIRHAHDYTPTITRKHREYGGVKYVTERINTNHRPRTKTRKKKRCWLAEGTLLPARPPHMVSCNAQQTHYATLPKRRHIHTGTKGKKRSAMSKQCQYASSIRFEIKLESDRKRVKKGGR
jgi:hypothetical protein